MLVASSAFPVEEHQVPPLAQNAAGSVAETAPVSSLPPPPRLPAEVENNAVVQAKEHREAGGNFSMYNSWIVLRRLLSGVRKKEYMYYARLGSCRVDVTLVSVP